MFQESAGAGPGLAFLAFAFALVEPLDNDSLLRPDNGLVLVRDLAESDAGTGAGAEADADDANADFVADFAFDRLAVEGGASSKSSSSSLLSSAWSWSRSWSYLESW